MNEITVITPPDILYNNSFSILLVFPNDIIKSELHSMLLDVNIGLNIYVYDQTTDKDDIEWLLGTSKLADITIVNIDNCDYDTKTFVSFLLANNKTFYLTNDSITPYNIINKNRIFDLKWLENVVLNIRGNNETKT